MSSALHKNVDKSLSYAVPHSTVTVKGASASASGNAQQFDRRFLCCFLEQVLTPIAESTLLPFARLLPTLSADLAHVERHHFFGGPIKFVDQVQSIGWIKSSGSHDAPFSILTRDGLTNLLNVLGF